MKIEFDPSKDAINRQKHGMSLALADDFEWDTAFVWPDNRFDYDEWRMAGLGYIGFRLFRIAFVDRGDTRRIISLRPANKREYRDYACT